MPPRKPRSSTGSQNKASVPGLIQLDIAKIPPDVDDPLVAKKRFQYLQAWIDKPQGEVRQDQEKLYYEIWGYWEDLDILITQKPELVRSDCRVAVMLAGRTVNTYVGLLDKKLTYPNFRKTPQDIVVEAMKFCVSFFMNINEEFERGTMDDQFFKEESFYKFFPQLLNSIIDGAWQVNSTVACSMLDVIAAIGPDLYLRVPFEAEHRIQPFFITMSDCDSPDISAQVKARLGRCMGKMIKFPSFRTDFTYVLDMYKLCERYIKEGENVMKTSYAWAFACWTDVLVEDYGTNDPNIEKIGLSLRILQTCLNCSRVPAKARYNIGRACGNIFSWIQLSALESENARICVRELTEALLSMMGTGMDYKLRWNCAYAVGKILQNPIFFEFLEEPVIIPIIKTLAKWLVNSQNFKERTQCAMSLRKAKTYEVYGERYSLVWTRLCMSLARLPVEESESIEKFKIECLLLFFHLIKMLKAVDLPTINDAVNENMQYLQALVEDAAPSLLMAQMDDALASVDILRKVEEELRGSSYEVAVSSLLDLVQLALQLNQ